MTAVRPAVDVIGALGGRGRRPSPAARPCGPQV